MVKAALLGIVLVMAGCGRQNTVEARTEPDVSHQDPAPRHQVRATGKVQAVRSIAIQVPQIAGQQGGKLTLIQLVQNGAQVQKDDIVAKFDTTQEEENARQAQAKFDDLSHQVEQKQAQNRADAEKRSSDLQTARADLAKARIELRKGPILAEIDRLKNEAKAQDAQAHVDSLVKSSQFHDEADAAALKILELQRDRQKLAYERAKTNAEKLVLHAPFTGRVSLENVWRNGSMGHAQEGDQLWWGQALLRVFDPTSMDLQVNVGEPDGAVLIPGARATVSLDAYPDLLFTAEYVSSSPVATSGLGSPIKSFTARFRFDKSDPHLLPDLSAAIAITPPEGKGGGG